MKGDVKPRDTERSSNLALDVVEVASMPLCKESDTVDGNWVVAAPHKPVEEALKMLGTSQLSRKG